MRRYQSGDIRPEWEDTAKLAPAPLATAATALTVGLAGAVMAQNRPAPGGTTAASAAAAVAAAAPRVRLRHLLFIATPGGGGR